MTDRSDRPTRRDFLTDVVRIATAGALSTAVTPMSAQALAEQSPGALDWDLSWVDLIAKATDRAVFDWIVPGDPGDPQVLYLAERYLDNCAAIYGSRSYDARVVLNIRTVAIGAALNDSAWERYSLGTEYKVKDPATGELAVRKPILASGARSCSGHKAANPRGPAATASDRTRLRFLTRTPGRTSREQVWKKGRRSPPGPAGGVRAQRVCGAVGNLRSGARAERRLRVHASLAGASYGGLNGRTFAPKFLPNRQLAMPSSPAQPPNRDPLQTLLKNTEEELRNRLHAACEAEAKGVSTESTEQIRRLEDDLLAAAVAAKQTIDVRSHMKQSANTEDRDRAIRTEVAANRDTYSSPTPANKPAPSVDALGDREVMGVSEFNDDRGKPWRAWSVVPGLSRASASGGGFLGNFQDGWICFESLGSSARRRLPFPRAKWPTISDDELKRLLERAADAPIREKRTGTSQ